MVSISSKFFGTWMPFLAKTSLLYQTPMTEGAETKAA